MRHRGLTALVLSLAIASPACRKKEAATATAPPPAPEARAAAPAASASAGGGGLVEDKALVDGHLLLIGHSAWDLGQSADIFDADPKTFARTAKASPAILEIRFPEPRALKGVQLKMGGQNFRVTATLKMAGGGAPKVFTKEFPDSGFDPDLELDFGGQASVESLRIEVSDLQGGDGHIHFRTLRLL